MITGAVINELTINLKEQHLSIKLLLLLILIFCITLVNSIGTNLNNILALRINEKINLYINDKILSKSVKLSMFYFDDPTTYNKIKLALQETPDACFTLVISIEGIVRSIVQIVGMIGILLNLNWIFTVFPLLISIPIFILRYKLSKLWYSMQEDRMENIRYINELKDLIITNENIKEIKMFNIGEFLNNIVMHKLKKENKQSFQNSLRYARLDVFSILLQEVCSLGIKIWMVLDAIKNRLSIGDISVYFSAIDTYESSFTSILQQFSLIMDKLFYIEYYNDIQELSEEDDDNLLEIKDDITKIEFKNVSFSYKNNENKVLNNISFTLVKNKIYGLVGENGSGKTTLLKLLLKIYLPTEGEIYINDINIVKISGRSLRKQMTAIFQDFIKYPLTVGENIYLNDKNVSKEKLNEIFKNVCLKNDIQKLPRGYDTQLKTEWEGGTNLSGGQWQKLALARCFYKKASCYVLDEPFSAIDQLAETNILNDFLRNKNEKIYVLVAHKLSFSQIADEIIVLKNGEIVEQGCHDELMSKKGLYSLLIENMKDSKEK